MNCKIKKLIEELHHQNTDPICAYIYDLEGIQRNVSNMLKTLPEKTNLFYAIKANPDKRIIEALLPLVKGFEVASIGELQRVREISTSIPILFGGPGKKDYELEMAIEKNVSYIHVESLLELRKLIMLTKKSDKHMQILLRINLRSKTLPKTTISMGGRPSQFGMDEQLIEEALSILRGEENTHVHLSGFHFHSLSNNMQAELHVEMINHYLQKVEHWKHAYGLDIKIINAGGGFGVSYDEKPGFDWQLFTSLLVKSEVFQNLGDTQLFFRTRKIYSCRLWFLCCRSNRYQNVGNRCFAILRGGTHHNRLPASWGHNQPFNVIQLERWTYPFQRPEISNSKVTIVGELCTPKDQLYEDADVESMRVGDAIIFEKSGAYCWTISHHDFLGHPHPNFYYITGELIMNKTITRSKSVTAEQLIMKDLMDAFIAEQFFNIDQHTKMMLSTAPGVIQKLYPDTEQTLIYIDKLCFIIEEGYRQEFQWVSDTPIYMMKDLDWVEIRTPLELSQSVLRNSLSPEAYEHPGVTNFLEGLMVSIEQLNLSLELMVEHQFITPETPYDWYVLGEMIASLRDRPFHPLSKAKIGFKPQDYQRYMAEFGKETSLYWVAICTDSIVKGCQEDEIESLDVLNDEQKYLIENELILKRISKEKYTIIPVHPWQMKNIILPNFKKEVEDNTIIILDSKAGKFLATSSVRSLISPYESVKMLKLPISVKSLGAARYLPVVKLLNGLAGEQLFRQAVACDETLTDRVFLCDEKSWWGYMPQTMGLFDDHPRHLSAQVRIYPQELMEKDYKIIPMSSLGVLMKDNHFLSEILGGELSNKEVVDFYASLSSTFYDITMRLFKVGIVPEIHGQNCCVVLKKNEIVGLLFRDHDSVRLHQPYLDKHLIKDPGYHIRPGYSNSLYNETIEELIYYVQSLGTQVNLAAIIETLSSMYNIPEKELWNITEMRLRESLQKIDIPEADRKVLHYELFEKKVWPAKLIIRPLLESDGVPGAMPSGKGIGYNPFYSNK